MKKSVFACVAATALLSVLLSDTAFSENRSFGNAQTIYVITEDEAILFSQFCAFYELRELLANSLTNASKSLEFEQPPIYEVRFLSGAGELKAHIGDHWISSADGGALIPGTQFDQIIELISRHKGKGISKYALEGSVRRKLRTIQDPAYAEQNLCGRT